MMQFSVLVHLARLFSSQVVCSIKKVYLELQTHVVFQRYVCSLGDKPGNEASMYQELIEPAKPARSMQFHILPT